MVQIYTTSILILCKGSTAPTKSDRVQKESFYLQNTTVGSTQPLPYESTVPDEARISSSLTASYISASPLLPKGQPISPI